jgi:hypothetical protein
VRNEKKDLPNPSLHSTHSSRRFRLSLLSWSGGIIQSFTTLVIGLFLTPRILETYGAERMGTYEVLFQWTALLTVLGIFAIMPGAQILLLNTYYRNEWGKFKGTLSYCLKWSFLAVFGSVLLGVTLVFFAPGLIQVEPQLRSELNWTLGIFFVSLLFAPLKMSDLVNEAAQKGFILRVALIIQNIATPLFILGFGYFRNTLFWYAFAGLLGNLVYTAISIFGAWLTVRKMKLEKSAPFSRWILPTTFCFDPAPMARPFY